MRPVFQIHHWRLSEWRFSALLLAVALYGAFGAPTPTGFGWPELLTGALLAVAADPASIARGFLFGRGQPAWAAAGSLLFAYGLTAPLAIGVAEGHDMPLILRDVIPFLFLLLPLFLAGTVNPSGRRRLALTVAAGLAGLAFALRLLVPAFIAAHAVGFAALPDADPERFANAPTVLFAAIMAFAGAGGVLLRRWTPRRGALAIVLCGAGLCAALAMTAAVQRASLALMTVILAALWLGAFVKTPLRAVPILLPLAILGLLDHAALAELGQHLAAKTAAVGFNNRPQEAEVVFGLVGRNPFAALFGLGWGQTLSDPAVGDATVNYTHTLGTALWLKTGFAGVALACLYLGGLAANLVRLTVRHHALGLALAAPFLIDITLYASYKSLDFGLLLVLIAAWDKSGRADGLRGRAEPAMHGEAKPPVLQYDGPHAG